MHAFSKLSVFRRFCQLKPASTHSSRAGILPAFHRHHYRHWSGRTINCSQDQFYALQQIQDIKLDKSRAGEARSNSHHITRTTDIVTPIGKITFHVVPADTPFLLCLKDLDDLRVKFDNLEKVLETLELQLRFLHMFLTHHQRFSQTLQQTWTLSRSSAEKEARDDRLRSNSVRRASSQLLGSVPFSRRKEIDGLLARGVFELISGDSREIGDARIFCSRLVDEVKGKGTATPYEKSA